MRALPTTWSGLVRLLEGHHSTCSTNGALRDEPRYELAGPVVVLRLPDSREALGQIVNVSAGGMGLELRGALRPGEQATTSLYGSWYRFRVVWCVKHGEGQYRAGLQLLPGAT